MAVLLLCVITTVIGCTKNIGGSDVVKNPHSSGKFLDKKDTKVDFVSLFLQTQKYEEPPVGGKGWQPGLPLPKKEKFEYFVEIHFLVYTKEIQRYPVIYNAFLHAVSIWGQYLPISVRIQFDSEFKRNSLGQLMTRPKMYRVHIGNLKEKFGAPPGQLGAWFSPPLRRLYLDEVLERDKRRALSVSMHELGHAFGLSHITGEKDLNYPTVSGNLIIPEKSAVQHLMFPFELFSNKWRWRPTPLEIRLAKRYVLNVTGTVASITGKSHCDHRCFRTSGR
jgi:hypothetical protein